MSWDPAVFFSAAAGVVTGSGIVGGIVAMIGRALMSRIRALETKVQTEQERRIEGLSKSLGYKAEEKDLKRVETEFKAFSADCKGQAVAIQLQTLAGWMKKCDMTLERLADETASQRSDIKHDHDFISDIAREFRQHVNNRSEHSG